MAVLGFLGTMLSAIGFEPAPLLLRFVLGRPLEEKLRQSLELSQGSVSGFLASPIAALLLGPSAIVVTASILRSMQELPSN